MTATNRAHIGFATISFEAARDAILNVVPQVDANARAEVCNEERRIDGWYTTVEVRLEYSWDQVLWERLIDRLKPVVGEESVKLIEHARRAA